MKRSSYELLLLLTFALVPVLRAGEPVLSPAHERMDPGLFRIEDLPFANELFMQEAAAFTNLLETLRPDDRPGWPSSRLVAFANKGPETNAVLVPLPNIDPHRPGPRMEWRESYTAEEVAEGRRRNHAARMILLRHCRTALDAGIETVALSEWLAAVTDIWGKDLVNPSWGHGFNSAEFHREFDGISSLAPLYHEFVASPHGDAETRRLALSRLLGWSEDELERRELERALKAMGGMSGKFGPSLEAPLRKTAVEAIQNMGFPHGNPKDVVLRVRHRRDAEAEATPIHLLDEKGAIAVSNLLLKTEHILARPAGTTTVQALDAAIASYESPDKRGFRPMECEMQIRCFIETNKFGTAAYLGNVLARLDRFSPEVQCDIFYTFSDLLIDPFLFDSDSEERKEETIRAFSLDIIPLVWSIARNANVSAEVRRWAWIHVGAAVQRGDLSAAPFAAGLKAADEAIAEAERETERERRLRMEAPPPTPSRTNAEPILVGVKVRRNRNPSSTTNAPPGFPVP